jgi:hypothetical protein
MVLHRLQVLAYCGHNQSDEFVFSVISFSFVWQNARELYANLPFVAPVLSPDGK